MFFPRLRRQAKWMFVLLALVFALGFVFFGVGSGSTGLGDLLHGNLTGIFGSHHGSGSEHKARGEIRKHPSDPKGYRDLATALETSKKQSEAIAPLETYTRLRPSDSDALSELAGLYLTEAHVQQAAARSAQIEGEPATAASLFLPPPSTKLGQALDQDPITNALATKSQTAVRSALAQAQSETQKAMATYRRVEAVTHDISIELQVASIARDSGDIPGALAAYERYLKLAPKDDPTVPEVRQTIKRLQSGSTAATG